MKQTLLLLLAGLGFTAAEAQIKMGANPGTINASSALEIEATNKGVLIPRVTLTTSTSTAFMIAAPVEGTLVYNSAGSLAHGFYYWDGAKWELLAKGSTSSSGSGVFSSYNNGTGVVMHAASNSNTATGNSGFASGYNNTASGQYSTALGQNNTVSGNTAFATGYSNNVSSQYGAALGQSNAVSGNTGFAAGYSNTVSSQYGIALGQSNSTTGNSALASGYNNEASGEYGTALGQSNHATGSSTFAIGYNNTASGLYGAAIGNGNTASGQAGMAFGAGNTASGANSTALGAGANTNNKAYSMVLADGMATTATASNQFTGHFINGYSLQANGRGIEIEPLGTLRPSTDAQQSLGTTAMRWSAVYAQNGTIQTSDIRLKDNIHALPYGLATIMQLHPIAYQWKSNGERKIGFSAQEVRGVIPEVVHAGDDPQQTLGINYAEMVSVLVKAVQEQQAQIDALKAENKRILETLKHR